MIGEDIECAADYDSRSQRVSVREWFGQVRTRPYFMQHEPEKRDPRNTGRDI